MIFTDKVFIGVTKPPEGMVTAVDLNLDSSGQSDVFFMD